MIRLVLALLLLLAALPARAAVRVVATVPDLAALAEAVGGDQVQVRSLALPTQDPHFVDAKPTLALALSRADLLLVVGLDLEVGWLPPLLSGARNPDIQRGAAGHLDCSQFARVLEKPAGPVDRAMGDVHPGGNPHYLVHPDNAVAVARGIAERLARLDPGHAADYRARAEAFAGEVAHAREHWEDHLSSLRGQPVIQYHRSWPYLEDWLGFELVADVEPKPGIPPSPAQVARVVALGKDRGVGLVLIQAYYPPSTAEQVAHRVGARLVRLPGGADVARGQTWIQRMDVVARLLAGEAP